MEAYLERCLTSLIVDDARMQLFETLVMNDGSKDRTSEIGHQFAAKYPNTFRVIDKENGHYGSCVNRGLKEAKGVFVKILDADDRFDTEVFKRYLDFLLRDDVQANADLILSDYLKVNEDGASLLLTKYKSYVGPVNLGQITSDDKMEWFIHGLSYRLENLTRMGYKQSEGIPYTDHEWAFIPMSTVRVLYKFDGSLYLYTVGRDGQSIADDVHAKNIGSEVKAIKNDISFYCAVKDSLDKEIRKFSIERLDIMIKHIYQCFLLTFREYGPDMKILEDLDDFIKSNDSELYEKTEKYSVTIANHRYYPIRYYRQSKIKLWMMQQVYAIANTINKFRQFRHRK